jgi:two-component system phosphate regulon response regulator PhoB
MSKHFSHNLHQNSSVMNISDITILVAEDNEESRIMLRTFLELQGYRVVEARDGEEAVKVACSAQPDLIIMDLNMPKLNGIEASEQIRQHKELNKVPIFTNSSSGKFGMDLFLNTDKLGDGYLEYIPKPFNFDYLVEQIKTVLLKTKNA